MNETAAAPVENHVSTLELLFSKRFWPLFWATFLGAFNDNLIKTGAILLITYEGLSVFGQPSSEASTIAPDMLILPALLLSAMAGQLADRYSKSNLIRPIKLSEIVLMGIAAVGFLGKMPTLLMLVILGLGIQSTFLGPLKYSILPQLLTPEELVAGNALIETGTNLAILTGSLLAPVLVSDKVHGLGELCVALIFVSVAGYVCARQLVHTPAEAPDLHIERNPAVSTWHILRDVHKTIGLFRAILAIGWFWAYGYALVALLVPYTHDIIHADEMVQGLFLGVFCIGVGVGSILCEKLSFDRLELGLVPLGSIGMTIFLADLFWAWHPDSESIGQMLNWSQFLAHPGGWRVTLDLLMLSIFTGFYIVPLYTFIQARADAAVRSRVVGANNIMGSVFMAVWAVIQLVLLHYMSPIQILLLVAVLNMLVAFYIYTVIPEFTLRFLIYILVHIMYRVRARNLSYIPKEGAAVLVCNHVSFVDWLIIYGLVSRPIRFVMYYGFAKIPILNILFRQAHVIPIASHKEDESVLNRAMERVHEELALGELVCIFPEGGLTHDGEIAEFKRGIERIVEKTPVPVIPMALQGLWGSWFSRYGGKAFQHPFHRVWSRVGLVAGPPVPPQDVKAESLHAIVLKLRGTQA